MPNAGTLTEESRFFGLFIGKSGSGKKGAACSFPGDTFYFDFDGRIGGLVGSTWVDRSKVTYEYYPPRSSSGLTVYERVNTTCESMLIDAKNGRLPYKNIVVGSLTGFTQSLVQDALGLTHSAGSRTEKAKGKHLGKLPMPGPEDYGFEANGVYQFLAFLRSMPVNVIVMAHIVDRYGRPESEGDENPYADPVKIGEKLSLRDKISENNQIWFNHVFRFEKKEVNNTTRFYVKFRTDVARTAFAKLPDGEMEFTKQPFYPLMMEKAGYPVAPIAPKV